jgi:hypothetical protein
MAATTQDCTASSSLGIAQQAHLLAVDERGMQAATHATDKHTTSTRADPSLAASSSLVDRNHGWSCAQCGSAAVLAHITSHHTV